MKNPPPQDRVMRSLLLSTLLFFIFLAACPACLGGTDAPGSAGAKVFAALGICLAAVCLIFYIVAKGREKD